MRAASGWARRAPRAGFRAVVSASFAGIFKQDSLKNSLLPIAVPPGARAGPFAAAQDPDAAVKIDLASQTLTLPSGRKAEFPVDGFSKRCLLNGACSPPRRDGISTRWRL
jgi:3-isopropylmalate/(R)-2-methylmalate dehydratase small subunit